MYNDYRYSKKSILTANCKLLADLIISTPLGNNELHIYGSPQGAERTAYLGFS